MTRAWGKFQPAMMAAPVWIRMDTITRVSCESSYAVKLHFIDGGVLDVRASVTYGADAPQAATLLTKVLMRDLSATKQKALTDYTGAVK